MAPTVPIIAAIVTFLAHIGAGYNLTAAQVMFSSHAFFNTIIVIMKNYTNYRNLGHTISIFIFNVLEQFFFCTFC